MMRSIKDHRWAVAALALLLLAAPAAPALATPQSGDDGDRVEELEREVRELRRILEELRDAEDRDMPAESAATAPQTQEETSAENGRLDELERRIDVLAAELERRSLGEQVAPRVITDGRYGLSPAASKVYGVEQGLSIGGYGEALYQSFDAERDDGAPSGSKDELDLLRAILYFGYKFDDKFVLNTEIELEHTEEASVEFAYLDYLWRPEANLRAGLVLIPMGLVNELHEPTVFLGARRPDVESRILPTTWRENGFGLFGEIGPVTYRTYLVNGFDGSGFSAAGLRGGRQKGGEALAEDFAWVGRVDVEPTPGLSFGGSLYSGGSDQALRDPLGGGELSVDTTIYEAHLDWRYRGLRLRALGAHAALDDVAGLNRALGLTGAASVGEELEGWYVELGYDVLAGGGGQALTPYVRFESYDTQKSVPAGFAADPANDAESVTLGLAYQPIDQLILKADYQDYDNGAGTGVDQINVALGYIF